MSNIQNLISKRQYPRSNIQHRKPLRVLLLNWRDIRHPLAGGAEISLLEHAKYWQKKGATITWFASSFKNAKREEIIDGIKIIRRGNHFTVHIHFLTSYVLNHISHNYDVVIDCFHFIPFFTPLYIKKKPIIGLINEVAGKVWFDNIIYPLSLFGFKAEPYFIRIYRKNVFITGSDSAKKDLIKVGIQKEKITVVNHGFTKFKFSGKIPAKEKTPTLLFLGRLSKDKGVEDVLQMLKLLIHHDKEITLHLVGKFESKDYEKKIKNLIDKFEFGNNCILEGFVSEEKKAELLAKAWLLVHPSRKEGWGLNVIEANSLGTPAVGYNVAGLSDSIVNGKTGILVDPNPISLADGVEKLLQSKDKMNNLSKNAIEWSKKFSWESAGEKSWGIIKKVS